MSDDDDLEPGLDGDPIYCSKCTSPIVLYQVPVRGVRLICCCPQTSLSIDRVASESSLFEPISGKWSSVDTPDVDDWG